MRAVAIKRQLASISVALCLAGVLAAPAHAQSQQPQQQPLRDAGPRPMRALDSIEGPVPEAAREAIAHFGACVADRSPGKARALLLSDFRTMSYRNGLRLLSENNNDCFKRHGKMRSAPLLFAGALAERLLQTGDLPLNVRLARAAGGNAPATFGATDQLAQCVVRSAPDETSVLFATPVATEAETRAIAVLDFVIGRCAQGHSVQMNPGGLRAILATAALRNAEAAK